MIIGSNHRYPFKGYGMWNTTTNSPAPRVVSGARRSGISMLRYPGGSRANFFDWREAIGPRDTRGCQVYGKLGAGKGVRALYGIREHMRYANMVGARTLLTMPFLNETPGDAAAWVEYMNDPVGGRNPNGGKAWAGLRMKYGHKAPYHVRTWTIGNEPYLHNQRFWLGHNDKRALRRYVNGANIRFTNQEVGKKCVFRSGEARTRQQREIKYPPVAPKSETIKVNGRRWHRVGSLQSQGPNERVYVINNNTGKLTFGDGTHGQQLPSRARLRASYTSVHAGFAAMRRAMKNVDKSIHVCSEWSKPTFVRFMGQRGYDCLAAHPYRIFNKTFSSPLNAHDEQMQAERGASSLVPKLRRTLRRQHRPNVSVLITEFGTISIPKQPNAPHWDLGMSDALFMASQVVGFLRRGVPVATGGALTSFNLRSTLGDKPSWTRSAWAVTSGQLARVRLRQEMERGPRHRDARRRRHRPDPGRRQGPRHRRLQDRRQVRHLRRQQRDRQDGLQARLQRARQGVQSLGRGVKNFGGKLGELGSKAANTRLGKVVAAPFTGAAKLGTKLGNATRTKLGGKFPASSLAPRPSPRWARAPRRPPTTSRTSRPTAPTPGRIAAGNPLGPYGIPGRFEARRVVSESGEDLTEITMRVHLKPQSGVSADDLARVQKDAFDSVDHYYNSGHTLPNGSRMQVKVEFTDDAAASHLVVDLHPGSGGANQFKWYVDSSPTTHAHELGHGLGLKDEYFDPTAVNRGATSQTPGLHTDDSLMGDFWQRPPGGGSAVVDPATGIPIARPGTSLKDRHLIQIGDDIDNAAAAKPKPGHGGTNALEPKSKPAQMPGTGGAADTAKAVKVDLNQLQPVPNSQRSFMAPGAKQPLEKEVALAEKLAKERGDDFVFPFDDNQPAVDGFWRSTGRPVQFKTLAGGAKGQDQQLVKSANKAYTQARDFHWDDVELHIEAPDLTAQQVRDRWAQTNRIPPLKPMPGGHITTIKVHSKDGVVELDVPQAPPSAGNAASAAKDAGE